jgi:hypothetical protein
MDFSGLLMASFPAIGLGRLLGGFQGFYENYRRILNKV